MTSSRERQFGRSVGTVLLLMSAWFAWRGNVIVPATLASVGAALLALGTWRASLLKPLSDAWWKFALVLGHLNARIILTVVFMLVFVPFGLLWRLTGRDSLRLRRKSSSTWSAYPARYNDPNHFRKMY